MANAFYAKGKEKILSGAIDFTTDTIKVALLKNTYPQDLAADEFHDDLSAYIIGTLHTLGRFQCTNTAVRPVTLPKDAWLIQDDTRIRMVPTPTQDGVLQLECYRLPLVPMAANDDTPEIARTHHAKLVHWAIYQGFMKPDSETIDPGRAAASNAAFTAYFGIRTDADTSKAVQANRPHVNKCVW